MSYDGCRSQGISLCYPRKLLVVLTVFGLATATITAAAAAASSTNPRANFNFTLGVITLDIEQSVAVSINRDLQFYQGLLLFQEQLNTLGGVAVSSSSSSGSGSGSSNDLLNVDLLYEVIFVSYGNATETLLAAQKLADDPKVGALTCSQDVGLSICAQVAAEAKMIFLSSSASDEMCSGPKDEWGNAYDYAYCPQLEASTYVGGIMNAAALLEYKKTAIYWIGYSDEVVKFASVAPTMAEHDYGLDVIFNGSFYSSPSDYLSEGTMAYNPAALQMLTEARDANVEVLLLFVGPEAFTVMEMMKSLNYAPPIVWFVVMATYDTWYYSTGELGNYVTSTTAWHHSMMYKDPFWGDTQKYSSHFTERYGYTPLEFNALGSAVGISLALAIEKGGGVSFEKINRGLGFVNDETMYGLMRFGQFNRNIGRDAVTVQWVDGEMSFVLPSSIATGALYYPMEPWVCRDKQTDPACFDEVQGVSQAAQSAFSIFAGIAIVLCLAALVGVYRKQHTTIFNRASPLFCKLLLLFGNGGYVSVMLYAMEPTETNGDILCPARTWMLAYSSTGVLASLFAKTWRLHRLFTENKGLVRQSISDKQLLGVMGLIFLGTTALMIGWTADPASRPRFSIVPQATLDGVGVATCSMDSAWLWINIAYFLLLNAWGAFLAYKVRKLPSSFNESKYIFFSLYNIFICIVVLLPIGAVMLKDTVSEDVTLCIGIMVAFSSVMVSIIGSKFLLLHFSEDPELVKQRMKACAIIDGESLGGSTLTPHARANTPGCRREVVESFSGKVNSFFFKHSLSINRSNIEVEAKEGLDLENSTTTGSTTTTALNPKSATVVVVERSDSTTTKQTRAAPAADGLDGYGGIGAGGGVSPPRRADSKGSTDLLQQVKELQEERLVLTKRVQELLLLLHQQQEEEEQGKEDDDEEKEGDGEDDDEDEEEDDDDDEEEEETPVQQTEECTVPVATA